LFKASSFSVIIVDLFSAIAKKGFQSLSLMLVVIFSICCDSVVRASLKRFSASSSDSTIANASSGQDCRHFGSPWHRSHAIAFPVSACMVIPPWSHACTHQSQPLHLFWSIISSPVSSDWERARSGQAFTHFASSHPLQESAKLSTGAILTTLILERIGFQVDSPFSTVQAYSQIPHPMHLPGSTEINFLCWVFADIALPNLLWS